MASRKKDSVDMALLMGPEAGEDDLEMGLEEDMPDDDMVDEGSLTAEQEMLAADIGMDPEQAGALKRFIQSCKDEEY